MSTTDLMIHVDDQGTAQWTAKAATLIRQMLCPEANDLEMAFFAQFCLQHRLDPFLGQVHLIPRYDHRVGRKVCRPEVPVAGMLSMAEESDRYRGRTPYEWCGPDGKWVDVWLSDEPPAAARVGVIRADGREPVMGVARWSTYAQRTRDGSLMVMWEKMPERMLAKCALALALREALPQRLSGVYSPEEMAQAGTIEGTVVVPLSAEQEETILQLSESAGIAEDVARRRLQSLGADEYDQAVATLNQRIAEQTELSA